MPDYASMPVDELPTIDHWSKPGSLPYLEMLKARHCLHRERDSLGWCRELRGCGDGWPHLACDCSQCGRCDKTKPSKVNPFSVMVYHQEPLPGATVEKCTVTACASQANNRGCWRIRGKSGRLLLFNFPSRAVAQVVIVAGGWLWTGHDTTFC